MDLFDGAFGLFEETTATLGLGLLGPAAVGITKAFRDHDREELEGQEEYRRNRDAMMQLDATMRLRDGY